MLFGNPFRRWKPVFSDGVIDLVELYLWPPDDDMGFGDNFDFMICPHGQRREAGRISLRLGESPCIYYFGHIGYHVDPPFRGNHYALRACRLLTPLIRHYGKQSVVITTDPDNIPSRKTCERLGCILERTVDVPKAISSRWEISPVKCRYIWKMDEQDGGTPFEDGSAGHADSL